jgi:hypothetical protein
VGSGRRQHTGRGQRPAAWRVYASLSEDDKFQVRVVVIGLVTVDCALELVYANETSGAVGRLEDQADTPPVGLLCASQLLNALVRTSSDPAWRYVSAIRSLVLGTEAVPTESDNSWRRNFFAGFVQALRWAAEQDGGSITRAAAIEQVSEACGFTDQSYTLHSPRGWIRRGEATAAGMWADRIYAQAERLKDGRSLSERVMSIGPKLWSESPSRGDLLSKAWRDAVRSSGVIFGIFRRLSHSRNGLHQRNCGDMTNTS